MPPIKFQSKFHGLKNTFKKFVKSEGLKIFEKKGQLDIQSLSLLFKLQRCVYSRVFMYIRESSNCVILTDHVIT